MEKQLADKLKRVGYPDYEVRPGEEAIPLLYIQGVLIGGRDYALSLTDDALKAFIDETVAAAEEAK